MIEEVEEGKVLMFYNANFNYGDPMGQSKYLWGIKQIDLKKKIKEQVFTGHDTFDLGKVFNFNLTAFNEVPSEQLGDRDD